MASGKTEDWVVTRTDHRSSQMIALYRRQAKTAAELNLGWFKPLHEIIPELAALGDESLAAPTAKTARTIESSDESSESTTPAGWTHALKGARLSQRFQRSAREGT